MADDNISGDSAKHLVSRLCLVESKVESSKAQLALANESIVELAGKVDGGAPVIEHNTEQGASLAPETFNKYNTTSNERCINVV